MKVRITSADLQPLKTHLLALAPAIKSSHRVEAMARGLGFQTHVALRTAVERGEVLCEVSDARFSAFLLERGGGTAPDATLSAAVKAVKDADPRVAIQTILAEHPDLSANGFRAFSPRLTYEENAAAFAQSRRNMIEPAYLAQFARAVTWLETRRMSKTVSRKRTSYGYKHQAEAHHREASPDADPYIANGMFIAAAAHLGFKLVRDGYGPNAFINIAAPKVARPRGLAGSLRGAAKRAAWRNMMVAAINAGLEQKRFGLAPSDNRWTGEHAIYRFDFGGLPALACAQDAGFGELSLHVAINPTPQADDLIRSSNAGFAAGEAFASGWFERELGAWLQTTTAPTGSISAALLERIVATRQAAQGFADHGRLMM